jgi:hypothetical protein
LIRRVVLIGAAGMFGRRMAARLALWPELELVLAGRRPEPLAALIAELQAAGGPARLSLAILDRDHPSEVLAQTPWAVVDAAGPFQGAGFDLAQAVIDAGAHWIDLADARDFVAGFEPRLDALARQRGVVAVTGASSTPAITGAALDRITAGWRRTDRVWAAIVPGAQTPGLSVTRAILSWAGQPMACLIAGQWTRRAGWSGLKRVRLPGVGRRLVSLAATPDLDLLPRRGVSEALFYAGVQPPLLHRLLWLAAWTVRLRLLPTLRPLAGPLRSLAMPLVGLGAHRGGMVVVAEGVGEDGAPLTARWSLAASRDAGPSVPVAPALAVLRALVAGRLNQPGAGPCVGFVDLDQIVAELAHLDIQTRSEAWTPDAPGLFPRVLGDDFAALPAAVRAVHGGGPRALCGQALCRGGGGPAAVARRLAGLPGPGRYEASVTVTPGRGGEVWTRRFGSRRFSSRLRAVKGEPGLFEERLGPVAFRFSAVCDAAAFRWIQEGWSLGPSAMPGWLGLKVRARSFERDGAYRFSVLVAHPWIGVLVAYAGRLSPAVSGPEAGRPAGTE